MWDKLWRWLTSSSNRSDSLKKRHPDLYPLDVASLAIELDLENQAKRLGTAGLPSTDAQTGAGPEALIVQKVEKARQDYLDWAVLRFSVLSEDMGRRDITQDINRARQADREFERKASALLTSQQTVLQSLDETVRMRRRILRAFQDEHQLLREAEYPTGAGSFFRYAVLLLLVVFEGVLNAGFFSQGLSTGLIGGFSYAAILAAINVGVAFSFGKFGVPYLNHRASLQRTMGRLFLTMAFSFMVAIGLGIAHIRDSLTAEMTDPAKVALETLISSPFHLHDFFSWILFAISICFAVGALFDGLYSDDVYPGYGAITRRAEEAEEDYAVELTSLREDLEDLKDEELKLLDKTVQECQIGTALHQSLIEDKRSAKLRLETALLDASYTLDALLRIFRTENEIHRPPGTRPPYFDRNPELRPLNVPDFSTAEDEERLNQQRQVLVAFLSEVQEIRARIQEAFNKKFNQLEPLDSHFLKKETV